MPIFFRRNVKPVEWTLKLHSCDDSASITCRCEELECVQQYKYSCIIVDRKLSWTPEILRIMSVLLFDTHAEVSLAINPSLNFSAGLQLGPRQVGISPRGSADCGVAYVMLCFLCADALRTWQLSLQRSFPTHLQSCIISIY